MYRVEVKRPARKALLRMPREMARRFLESFERLARDPQRGDLDIKPLTGRPGYRLRIGDWRALYTVDGGRLLILVAGIGTRGGAYK